MADRLRFAVYWGSMCGGCDISLTHLNEKLLDVVAIADFLFWPCAMDFKMSDLEGYADKSIDICFYNGGIRTEEHRHIAELLRRKSKVLVAYGTCAHLGGITGLGNTATREELFKGAYFEETTTVNPGHTLPQKETTVAEGVLTLPGVLETALTLDMVVDVDYYLPGCPPEIQTVTAAVEAIAAGTLPPKGTVIGVGARSLCEECPRKKGEKKVKSFKRPHEIIIEPGDDRCLLELGLICCGPATAEGCGAKCPSVNMPCRGCYGPPAGVFDQGAKLLSAVASLIDSDDEKEIEGIVEEIADPLGTFYRYALPKSMLAAVRA